MENLQKSSTQQHKLDEIKIRHLEAECEKQLLELKEANANWEIRLEDLEKDYEKKI